MTNKSIDIYKILEYLPHRFPFMMIDRVIDWEAGSHLHAIKNITFNEPQFMGHFPNNPVMPGVLIIEALAQASGILTYLTLGRVPAPNEANYLVGVDNARFKQVVMPGDKLDLHVTMGQSKRGISKFHAKAMVGDNVACEVDIMNATRVIEK